MVAFPESTPGPIGINMETYVAYVADGGVLRYNTSVSVMLISVICKIFIEKSIKAYKSSSWLINVSYGLRATIAALISFTSYIMRKTVILNSSFNINSIFSVFIFLLFYYK